MHHTLLILAYSAVSAACMSVALLAWSVARFVRAEKRMESYYDAANSEYRITPIDTYIEQAKEEIALMLEEVGGF